MTPKAKALELYNKYSDLFKYELPYFRHTQELKQSAIICVQELLKNEPGITISICVDEEKGTRMEWNEYWQEVEKEIKLIQ